MFDSSGLLLILVATLIRWLVAQFPHSGQGVPPMYGDYEAQRHWMEITTNLPIKDWYKNSTDNDLAYWGLDYPPLTAYHMYLMGELSSRFFNSSWTELHASRGHESQEHKLFMRSTVLAADLIIYMPAILYYFYRTTPIYYNSQPSTVLKHNIATYAALAILYPGQILIDHGHFQYNCVFMGLVLWAVIFLMKGKQTLSALLFTLGLCYKQMSLYYSLPFFWLIAATNLRAKPIFRGLLNILAVGSIVLFTFALIFSPYLLDGPAGIMQVIQRLFPFNRGLFEDKVANLWFSLSIFHKFKELYNLEALLKVSTGLTMMLSLPSGLHLVVKPSIRNFKYALVNTSLVFFLTSFQVHEKTILVPALPVLLFYREHPMVVNWFCIISTFTLQPLLIKDGQVLPYFVLMTCYTLVCLEAFRNLISLSLDKFISIHNLNIVLYLSSIFGCFVLSIAATIVNPPPRYPHIHPTINSLYGCAHFIMFLLFFYYKQFRSDSKRQVATDRIVLIKKTK